MAADSDSFLPRIQSVFYAIFDVRQGPKIVYQVPEGLIASSSGAASGNSSFNSSPIPSLPPTAVTSASSSRASSISLTSPSPYPSPSPYRPDFLTKLSPQKRSLSAQRTLFYFDDISKYVIPRSEMCGRLVICATKKYKIIGFPAELRGDYERNYFRFNLCFVFDRSADLSCYEPVVRKVSRVLTSCEEESSFLSSPDTSPKIHAILEQLYEDLNSYSETSIPVDRFNSIELKIFPFYPNPPPVKDWAVPLALIDLQKIIEPNWDLTMVKVCKYIDGTNHVSRIAHLADCDIELTRQAISHLLYYQVIMTIDIFQYSNMYTLRKSIQWLACESHVREECGPYVTKEGKMIPDWPKLLHLYSRLKPGKSVFDWMQDHDIRGLGIDARRFTSFGVIKGFLRRVHRWPVLVSDSGAPKELLKKSPSPPSPEGRKRAASLTAPPVLPASPRTDAAQSRLRRRPSDASAAVVSPDTKTATRLTRASASEESWSAFSSRRSIAELNLEQVQRGVRPPGAGPGRGSTLPSPVSPRAPRTYRLARRGSGSEGRRNSLKSPQAIYDAVQGLAGNGASGARDFSTLPARPRPARTPSSPAIATQKSIAAAGGQEVVPLPVAYPPELAALLDGEHHTDELCTKFEVGWPVLETWLVAIGEGKGNGDYGKVLIIHR